MLTDRPGKNKNQFSKNMKLPVSKTNAPVWRDITVKSVLPEALKPLETLSRNLWWVWNSAAKNLFRDLDPDLWLSLIHI